MRVPSIEKAATSPMINEKASDEKIREEEGSLPDALIFCQDLMFGVQLQNMARAAGLRPVQVRPGAPLPTAGIMVVDLNSRANWRGVIEEAAGRGTRVVAFGPHTDAESRRRAKEAGASRVLANSNMGRDLPAILAAYARETNNRGETEATPLPGEKND